MTSFMKCEAFELAICWDANIGSHQLEIGRFGCVYKYNISISISFFWVEFRSKLKPLRAGISKAKLLFCGTYGWKPGEKQENVEDRSTSFFIFYFFFVTMYSSLGVRLLISFVFNLLGGIHW